MNGVPESADIRHFWGLRDLSLSDLAADGMSAGHSHAVLVVPLALVRNPVTLRFLSGVARDVGTDMDQDVGGGAPCAARKIPKVANLPPGELNLATSLMGTGKRRAIERKSDEQIFRT